MPDDISQIFGAQKRAFREDLEEGFIPRRAANVEALRAIGGLDSPSALASMTELDRAFSRSLSRGLSDISGQEASLRQQIEEQRRLEAMAREAGRKQRRSDLLRTIIGTAGSVLPFLIPGLGMAAKVPLALLGSQAGRFLPSSEGEFGNKLNLSSPSIYDIFGKPQYPGFDRYPGLGTRTVGY